MQGSVELRNTAAHVKHLNLGGGVYVHVPPTLDDAPPIVFRPKTDDEADRLVLALANLRSRAIARGELRVEGIDLGPDAVEAAKRRMLARAAARAAAAKPAAPELPQVAPPPPSDSYEGGEGGGTIYSGQPPEGGRRVKR